MKTARRSLPLDLATIGILAVALTCDFGIVDISQARGQAGSDSTAAPPGEGIFCALAIYSLAEEVGKRCFPGGDKKIQAEISRSVGDIDSFVLKNSSMTSADIEEFKREQSHIGGSEAFLCHGDALALYQHVRSQGSASLHAGIASMISRPGKPTWGTCL